MGKVALGLLDEADGFISQTVGGRLNMGALHGRPSSSIWVFEVLLI